MLAGCARVETLYVARHFFFSSRGRHTSSLRDWSSDVCSSDLLMREQGALVGDRDDVVVERAGGDRCGGLLDEKGARRIEPVQARDRLARLAMLTRREGAAQIGRASCRGRAQSSRGGGGGGRDW